MYASFSVLLARESLHHNSTVRRRVFVAESSGEPHRSGISGTRDTSTGQHAHADSTEPGTCLFGTGSPGF